MRARRLGLVLPFAAVTLLLPPYRLYAQAPPPSHGICVLASDIGATYPVDALLEFVEKGGFDPVVIDWAWITSHWPRTDFAAVNRFRKELCARGVEVPAMYRPRFSDKPTVPEQVKPDGTPIMPNGHRICFSSAEARQWGLSWGHKILEQCPDFEEIIVYCPANECRCPACSAARAADPDAPYKAVWRFLQEAKTSWQARKPGVKLGVVYFSDTKFWTLGEGIFDVARPFIEIYDKADLTQQVAAAQSLQEQLGPKMRACTGKITFGAEDKVPAEKVAEFARAVRAAHLSYYLWLFDTAFVSRLYDPRAVAEALGLDWEAIRPSLARMGMGPERSVALVLKAAETRDYRSLGPLSEASDDAVQAMAALMDDPQRPIAQRSMAAIALAYTKSPLALPALLKHVADDNAAMRQSVVTALPYLRDESGEARKALATLAESDPYTITDPKTGAPRYIIREIAKGGLTRLANTPASRPAAPAIDPSAINPPRTAPEGRVNLRDALAGKVVTLIQVGDVMRFENTGTALQNVDFRHYYPVIDAEQIALGRWLTAQTADGQALPVSITAVVPDEVGNLVHTFRLAGVPEKQTVLIRMTSLVARRERPAPQGAFPILAAEQYPPAVRPFLRATAAVPSELPEIRVVAEQLLAQTHDAYELAQKLAEFMKTRPYDDSRWEPGVPTVVNVLRHGGACCASAITAAAVLRACGIPAQLTYTCPWSLIHGIIRLYLSDYGWVRMDATCGSGLLPLVQREADLGLARLYDTPIEAEVTQTFWGWPFVNREVDGTLPFRVGGQPCPQMRLAPQGYAQGLMATGNAVLGGVPCEGAWQAWDGLVNLSRTAVTARTAGEFTTLTSQIPGLEGFVQAAQSQGQPISAAGRED